MTRRFLPHSPSKAFCPSTVESIYQPKQIVYMRRLSDLSIFSLAVVDYHHLD
ncbi:hypothetical protein BGW41_006143, partial [Actinomortierella wolfii]